MKKLTPFLILFFFCRITCATPDDLFREANAAYQEENYSLATELYDSLISGGYSSGELFFNMGNASYRTGKLASARLYYEKALQIMGNDEELLKNLSLTKEKLGAGTTVEPRNFFQRIYWSLLSLMDVTAYSILTLILLWLGAGGFIIYFLSSGVSYRKAGFFAGLIFLILSGISGFTTFRLHRYQVNENEAIIFDPGVFVKSSPSDSGTDLLIIHEGKKVRILDRIDDWYEIEVDSEKRGWVKGENIRVI